MGPGGTRKEARLSEVAGRLAEEGRLALPVVDFDQRGIGVLRAQAMGDRRPIDQSPDGVAPQACS